MAPEYGVDIPLWGPWEDLHLPHDLLERLAAWQHQWEHNVDWESGTWRSGPEALNEWRQVGEELADDLRSEVGDRAPVEVPTYSDEPPW